MGLQPQQIDTFDNLQNAVIDLLWGKDPSQLNLLLLRHLHERRQGWITTTTGIHLEPAFLYAEALRSLRDHLPPDMRPHDLQLATSFRTGLHQYIQSQLATVEMLRRHQPHGPPMTLDDLVQTAQQIQIQVLIPPPTMLTTADPGQTPVHPPHPTTSAAACSITNNLIPAASHHSFSPASTVQPAMPALNTVVPPSLAPYDWSLGTAADLYNAPSASFLTPGLSHPAIPAPVSHAPAAVHTTITTGHIPHMSTAPASPTSQALQDLSHTVTKITNRMNDRFNALTSEVCGSLAMVNSSLSSSGRHSRPRSDSPPADRPPRRVRFSDPLPLGHPPTSSPFCRPCFDVQARYDHDPDRCWGPCHACGMRGHKAGSRACTRRLPEAQAYVPQQTPHSRASTSSVTLNTFDLEKMIRQAVHDGQNMCTPASLTRQALERRSRDSPGTS